jgi:hypothetical protein
MKLHFIHAVNLLISYDANNKQRLVLSTAINSLCQNAIFECVNAKIFAARG